jgi:hypothetical protein
MRHNIQKEKLIVFIVGRKKSNARYERNALQAVKGARVQLERRIITPTIREGRSALLVRDNAPTPRRKNGKISLTRQGGGVIVLLLSAEFRGAVGWIWASGVFSAWLYDRRQSRPEGSPTFKVEY